MVYMDDLRIPKVSCRPDISPSSPDALKKKKQLKLGDITLRKPKKSTFDDLFVRPKQRLRHKHKNN